MLRLSGHAASVFDLAVAPDTPALLLSGGQDSRICLWDVRATGSTSSSSTLQGIRPVLSAKVSSPVSSVSLSPDGRIAYVGMLHGVVEAWDLAKLASSSSSTSASSSASSSVLWSVPACTDDVRSLNISPDGRSILVGGFDGTVKSLASTSGTTLTDLRALLAANDDAQATDGASTSANASGGGSSSSSSGGGPEKMTCLRWHPRYPKWNGYASASASGRLKLVWEE